MSRFVWGTTYLKDDEFVLFSKDILPDRVSKSDMSPILLWQKDKNNQIAAITNIEYDLDEGRYNLNGKIITAPVPINAKIVNEFQGKLTNKGKPTLFVCGSFPIFDEDKKPPYEFIASLYQLFLDFNNPQKLKWQYQNSNNICYMRAHFVSEFLRIYLNLPTL